ncbi:MAG: DUF29 domain-containing protein [Xenococcaceae cyanobacterium MO_234.B1]|nr:DUF29 domain-containing protein [Xenococcaceae cyanobacterium MO_234.B1]
MQQLQKLHKKDFNLWLKQTALAIRNRDFTNMDWDNLLEEIEDMGASQKRALRSYTKRLIDHILKLRYWYSEKEYNAKGWRTEIINFRDEIKEILQESPSLKNYLEENYKTWYNKCVRAMKEEFDIPNNNFIPLEIILRDDFFE